MIVAISAIAILILMGIAAVLAFKAPLCNNSTHRNENVVSCDIVLFKLAQISKNVPSIIEIIEV